MTRRHIHFPIYSTAKPDRTISRASYSMEREQFETPAANSAHGNARRRNSARRYVSRMHRTTLLALVLVASILTLACGAEEVVTVATETEAIEIVDVLRSENFDVAKREVGEGKNVRWRITVKDDMLGGDEHLLAMQVLRDYGLPHEDDRAEDAAKSSSFITTESEEAARRLHEGERQIEKQLRSLPNVVRANVKIVLAESDPLNLKPYPASASVVIVHRDAKFSLTPEALQNMVARNVANLQPQMVAITLSSQPPRPVARLDSNARRRNLLLIAGGVGLLLVFGSLLLVFFLQNRRQQAQLAALHHDADARAEDDEATDAAPPPDHRWLDNAKQPADANTQ